MTAKSFTRNAKGDPIKMPGWFSWRHQSRDAHDAARAAYLAEHGPEARRRKAAARKLTADVERAVTRDA